MEVDASSQANNSSSSTFNCGTCQETFENRSTFMRHKKISHPDKVNLCEKFLKKECQRDDASCWFKHIAQFKKSEPVNSQDFYTPRFIQDPPDLKQFLILMKDLSKKVESLEEKFLKKTE